MSRRSNRIILAGKILVEFVSALVLWYCAHHLGVWLFTALVTAGATSGYLTVNWVKLRVEVRRDAR